MTQENFTLEEAREAYRRVSARAVVAARLISELRTKRIWIDHKKGASAVAINHWDVADDSAWEDFSSPKEYFKYLLDDKLAEPFLPTDEIEGRPAVCVRPFLAEAEVPFSNALGLSGLRVGSEAYTLLVREGRSQPVGQLADGLSDWEVDILAKALCERALVLVNAMRNVQTALGYVKTTRSGKYSNSTPKHVVREDEGIDALVTKLEAVVTLGFAPPPAPHFSSQSDQVNCLRALPREALELGRVEA